MRYVLGPALGPFKIAASAPPVEVKDVLGDLVSYDDSGAVLAFPAFDVGEYVAPSEVRLYGLPVGLPIPATFNVFLCPV